MLYLTFYLLSYFYLFLTIYYYFFVGLPHLATYIFYFSMNEPELGAGIDPGMAFNQFPSWIWIRRDSNSQPLDRESSSLTTRLNLHPLLTILCLYWRGPRQQLESVVPLLMRPPQCIELSCHLSKVFHTTSGFRGYQHMSSEKNNCLEKYFETIVAIQYLNLKSGLICSNFKCLFTC